METYPILIDGELAGKLTVDRQGARTVFDAECRMRPDLVRLSVYGGGKEGYLGVLAPENGALRLHRALSRSELRAFPAEIESAERAGLDRRPEPEAAPGRETDSSDTAEPEMGSAHGDAPEESPVREEDAPRSETAGAESRSPHGDAPDREVPPAAQAARETAPSAGGDTPPEGLSWYASPDGALVCFDGARSLIALPADDARVPADIAGERRTVEGREYLVYQTKNGKIVR